MVGVDLLAEVAGAPASQPPVSVASYGVDDLSFWRALGVVVRLWRRSPPHVPPFSEVAWAYNKYLLGAAQRLHGGEVSLRFLPYQVGGAELEADHQVVLSCVYPALRRFHRLLFYRDWAMLFTIALKQRNASLLLLWFVRLMTRVGPLKHKRLLLFLEAFFYRLDECNPSPTQHLGVKLVVKGKISVTGNAKTRTRHLGVGKRSLSTRGLRLRFSQRQVPTPTGALGAKCFIFY
jgi:hypothetical protein